MMQRVKPVPGGIACAAVVLHEPTTALLEKLAGGLKGRTLFAFLNGPVGDSALSALRHTDLRILKSTVNVGLARGLNAAMEAAAAAGFTHVMLLDQDSEPPIGILDTLLELVCQLEAHNQHIAALAPRLVPPPEGNYKPIKYSLRKTSYGDATVGIDFAPTSGSLISVAAFGQIGAFREDFFIGGIDVEWGLRAWDRGWATVLAIDLTMAHRWGEAAVASDRGLPQILRHAPLRNYYYSRNVVATARLPHVPLRWRIKSYLTLASQIMLLAIRGNSGSLRFIRDGLWDGFRGRLGPAPPHLL